METNRATPLFAALAHPGRSAVLRLLIRFAPQTVRPTEMATALDLRPNTLSHHLSDLADAGLIAADRQGRSILYRADLTAVTALVGHLVTDCGRGRPDLLAGQPITGHWGLPDPVKATGTDADKALVFARTYAALRRRVQAFVALPFDTRC